MNKIEIDLIKPGDRVSGRLRDGASFAHAPVTQTEQGALRILADRVTLRTEPEPIEFGRLGASIDMIEEVEHGQPSWNRPGVFAVQSYKDGSVWIKIKKQDDGAMYWFCAVPVILADNNYLVEEAYKIEARYGPLYVIANQAGITPAGDC